VASATGFFVVWRADGERGQPETVIASESEAIQEWHSSTPLLDCFVAVLLAMTVLAILSEQKAR